MSSVSITRGGRPVDVKSVASADQETIFGNGTAGSPLRASSSPGSTFAAAVANGTAQPGLFVTPLSSGAFRFRRVALGDASADDGTEQQIIGVITGVADNGFAQVQVGGIVELDESDWDVATGGSGGLVPAGVYYLAASPGGGITTSPPSGSGEFVVQVGIALNTTTMITSTPSVAIENP